MKNCLQICAQLSNHKDQILLVSDKASLSQGANASSEAVKNEGTQECEPTLGVTAARFDITTFVMPALQSSVMLYQTVKNLQSRSNVIRELLQELEALQSVLQVLEESVGNLHLDLESLDLPLRRCTNACRDLNTLIKRSTSHSTEERSSKRDWLKLRYLGGDISF